MRLRAAVAAGDKMKRLNEFTGIRTATLERRLANIEKRIEEMSASDEELGGGSPYESLYEEMDDIETELHRREVERS